MTLTFSWPAEPALGLILIGTSPVAVLVNRVRHTQLHTVAPEFRGEREVRTGDQLRSA